MTANAPDMTARIPVASYRLQFNHQFTFPQATALIGYLKELGISDCYASPLLMARPGSLHGYDVVDHSKLNPELGTEAEFIAFASGLKNVGMGLIADVVPNHMCIASANNRWWNDVLENGPGSPFAKFFDIDWRPPKADLTNKILLPVLGDQYGRVIESQEIKVESQRGAFFMQYYETRLPIAPRTYAQLLTPIVPELRLKLGESHTAVLEFESILTALGHLPPRTDTNPERVRERGREKEIIKRRLSVLMRKNREVRRSINRALTELNGELGIPDSFDRLEKLMNSQAYRLSFWRVAADEINYRRFFDVNELAAIRIEEPAVFTAVHELTLRLLKQGLVTGLRIDHVDGLFAPAQYFRDLQRNCLAAPALGKSTRQQRTRAIGKPFYIVVEKILGRHEDLRPEWDIYGTTGYDVLNLLNGIFVAPMNRQPFHNLYERFIGQHQNFSDLTYECKKLILSVAMSSELHVLARRLDRISEQHRYTRDFTFNSLHYALGEVIACFPVYRSYTNSEQGEISADDRPHIATAIRAAKKRNPAISPSIFDFIGAILLLEDPPVLHDSQRGERREFVLRFQQLTGPVMAKGLEDTAFYRYYPLASLNEVGGEPERFGVSIESFHREHQQRLTNWPHGIVATSTHDTKRSEDVRARINVLSEMPTRWYRAIRRWQDLNRIHKKTIDEIVAPDANEEYLLYQTLIGTWPLVPMDEQASKDYRNRIEEYLVKAIKEAKFHSSWISPHEEYENAARAFIRAILVPGPENRFLSEFVEFQAPITHFGMFNSLAQTLLKITVPGVPDFYQGTELWDFSLVDPDNRRPVEYEKRLEMLASLQIEEQTNRAALVDRLVADPQDGRLKLYLTHRALTFRHRARAIFEAGAYMPQEIVGMRANHVVAFARTSGDQTAIVTVGRFLSRLKSPIGQESWGTTSLLLGHELGHGTYRDVLTDQITMTVETVEGITLPLGQIFTHLPLALLERIG
jgi:(1->4)-alpha-D-glucan 1-alpha-D-glucosylmutase